MDELFRLVSDKIAAVIESRLAADKLSELRIRNGMPVSVCYGGKYYFLAPNGLTENDGAALVAGRNEAEEVIMRACGKSLYTVTDTIRKGYVSVEGGLRIGVCGRAVTSGDGVVAVKDFSSVNIRLPHEVKGCASALYRKAVANGTIMNTLIVSPPGAGKTTVLRDFCRLASDDGFNVLLCDEKFELASTCDGRPTLDVGKRTDVMSGQNKRRTFEAGIAYMRPDIIMTDELFADDIVHVLRAVHCGISVAATVHARDLGDFKAKPEYSEALEASVFERYAVLHGAPDYRISVYDGNGAAV